MHIYHPETWDPKFHPSGPVLCDACERCQEHAEHPFESLDLDRIKHLKDLGMKDGPWLSNLDYKAAAKLYGVPAGDGPQ